MMNGDNNRTTQAANATVGGMGGGLYIYLIGQIYPLANKLPIYTVSKTAWKQQNQPKLVHIFEFKNVYEYSWICKWVAVHTLTSILAQPVFDRLRSNLCHLICFQVLLLWLLLYIIYQSKSNKYRAIKFGVSSCKSFRKWSEVANSGI